MTNEELEERINYVARACDERLAQIVGLGAVLSSLPGTAEVDRAQMQETIRRMTQGIQNGEQMHGFAQMVADAVVKNARMVQGLDEPKGGGPGEPGAGGAGPIGGPAGNA